MIPVILAEGLSLYRTLRTAYRVYRLAQVADAKWKDLTRKEGEAAAASTEDLLAMDKASQIKEEDFTHKKMISSLFYTYWLLGAWVKMRASTPALSDNYQLLLECAKSATSFPKFRQAEPFTENEIECFIAAMGYEFSSRFPLTSATLLTAAANVDWPSDEDLIATALESAEVSQLLEPLAKELCDESDLAVDYELIVKPWFDKTFKDAALRRASFMLVISHKGISHDKVMAADTIPALIASAMYDVPFTTTIPCGEDHKTGTMVISTVTLPISHPKALVDRPVLGSSQRNSLKRGRDI